MPDQKLVGSREELVRVLETQFPRGTGAPQNLSYSLHEAGGGNDWWNRFQPVMEVQSILGTPVG